MNEWRKLIDLKYGIMEVEALMQTGASRVSITMMKPMQETESVLIPATSTEITIWDDKILDELSAVFAAAATELRERREKR